MVDKSRCYSVVYDRGIDPFQDPFPIPQMVHSRLTQPTGVELLNKSVHFILVGIQSRSPKLLAAPSLSCASQWDNRLVMIKRINLIQNYILVFRTCCSIFIISRGL